MRKHPEGITYGVLGVLVDPSGEHAKGAGLQPHTRKPFRGLNRALGHISTYEVQHGRPMLSAVVITADDLAPGSGFSKLAEELGRTVSDPRSFWENELDAVLEFWNSLTKDPTRLIDSALRVT
jgi:hypothetical protein